MFASFVEQDEEVKEIFYQKIKEKMEKEKQKHLDKISEGFFGWLLEPIADIAYTWRRDSEKKQGNSGENSVSWALHFWLPSDALIVNDLVLEPMPDDYIQIDHLVLNSNGIFVLETKSWDGAFLGSKNKWRMRQGNKWVEVKSPTKQNERHVRLFKTWLEENLPEIFEKVKENIYPIVVFKRAKWVKAENCNMPVVIGGMEAVGEIKKIKGDNISEEQINKIIEAIKRAKPLDHEEWNKKHSKGKNNYQLFQGKNSSGKMYIRIKGTKEDAEKVADEYKNQNYTISDIRQDKKEKDVWFFYYSK
ncbi:nuclease-related domain-containing protein [Thermoanaerobacterium thermosaccharolyticum]|uniref:nuclease-related domain-containing protein n=1 Tax=Thermoanaerobacterium thermosaccharolyticum TaxID=1517 RepID=UPI003DA99D27